jgi:hypothetical protein
MEGLMASIVALDRSPMNILRSFRGEIVAARIAYPDVLHLELRDSSDGIWRLATQDAEWKPADPETLVGRTIDVASINVDSGELGCRLSDGAIFKVIPGPQESSDDPPNWELFTPEGILLEFGPGVRWQIAGADSRASSRL